MENEALVRYRDYPAQRRILELVLSKLWAQDLPGSPIWNNTSTICTGGT